MDVILQILCGKIIQDGREHGIFNVCNKGRLDGNSNK